MKTELLYQTIIRVPQNVYPDFSDRLSFAMTWRNCSTQELALQLYLSRSTVSGYQNGHRTPDIATLIKIASILHVSTDFLLGLTDYICVD